MSDMGVRGQLRLKPHSGEFSGVLRLDRWRAINAETTGARIPKVLTLTNFPKSPFHFIPGHMLHRMHVSVQSVWKQIDVWWDTFNSHHLWTVPPSWNDLKWEIGTLLWERWVKVKVASFRFLVIGKQGPSRWDESESEKAFKLLASKGQVGRMKVKVMGKWKWKKASKLLARKGQVGKRGFAQNSHSVISLQRLWPFDANKTSAQVSFPDIHVHRGILNII